MHKTFHCYTVRAKQGGSQSSADNRSGSSHPKSAGASLRRYNEASLKQHVEEIMSTWQKDLDQCSLIFVRAVSGNKKILFSKILNKNDSRLVTIPFPPRRATFKEVKRVHEVLMTIELHHETVEELKQKLLDEKQRRNFRNSAKNPPRKIRRSKSRETPKRELPDFVQSLADEAGSESEEEGGFLKSDLQEFEATKKRKSQSP